MDSWQRTLAQPLSDPWEGVDGDRPKRKVGANTGRALALFCVTGLAATMAFAFGIFFSGLVALPAVWKWGLSSLYAGLFVLAIAPSLRGLLAAQQRGKRSGTARQPAQRGPAVPAGTVGLLARRARWLSLALICTAAAWLLVGGLLWRQGRAAALGVTAAQSPASAVAPADLAGNVSNGLAMLAGNEAAGAPEVQLQIKVKAGQVFTIGGAAIALAGTVALLYGLVGLVRPAPPLWFVWLFQMAILPIGWLFMTERGTALLARLLLGSRMLGG